MHSSVNQELTPSGQEVGTFLSMSVLGFKSVHLPLARPVKVMIMIHVSLLCNGLGTFLPFFANKSGRRGAWGSKHSSLLSLQWWSLLQLVFLLRLVRALPHPHPIPPLLTGATRATSFGHCQVSDRSSAQETQPFIYCVNQHMGDQRCWS